MKSSSAFSVHGESPGERIEFVPCPDISSMTFSVTAVCGNHTVSNHSLTILGATEFLEKLAEFERSRTSDAELTGTYDFHLRVAPSGSTGDALVQFHLSDTFVTHPGSEGSCTLRGGFVVAGENVAEMLESFRQLLD